MAAYDGEIRTFIFIAYFLFTIVQGLVLFLGTALFVAGLCLSYRHLVGDGAREGDPEDATSLSEWGTDFVLPIALALVLALAVYWLTGALNLPRDAQVLSAAVAGLGLMVWKIYRLETRKRGAD